MFAISKLFFNLMLQLAYIKIETLDFLVKLQFLSPLESVFFYRNLLQRKFGETQLFVKET